MLPAHFGRFFGFKRVSVSMWMNGRATPHPLHESKVKAALDAVRRAVDGGHLPISPLPRNTRYDRTTAALRAVYKPAEKR